jgi:F420H(2)-dependent quinone reductase
MTVGDLSLGWLAEGHSRRRRVGVVLGWLVDLPVVGHWLAWLARLPNQLPGSSRLTRLHALLLRISGGRLRRSWLFAAGQPVLSLTTTGRRTGKKRSTAVACFASDGELVVAGMNLGLGHDPAWALNLEANPDATIDIDGTTVQVKARRATGREAASLWQRWTDLQPSAPAFHGLADREIPLFVLSRGEALPTGSPSGPARPH